MTAGALVLCVVLPGAVDLDVHRVPARGPRTLAMRTGRVRAAAVAPARVRAALAAPRPPESQPLVPEPAGPASRPADVWEPERRFAFRMELGYGVDQGITLPDKTLGPDVRQTRAYSMGDFVALTHGALFPQLSAYLAGRFFVDQDGAAAFAAVPTVFDATQGGRAFLLRSGYAEVARLGPKWLQPLTVRAGRQYRYGLSIAQFDGLSAVYDTPAVALSLFGGRRVALYGLGSDFFGLTLADPGQISGGGIELRLATFAQVPIRIGFDYLVFDQDLHLQGTFAVDFSRDVTANVFARIRDPGDLAEARAEIRARLSKVTTVSLVLDDRAREDWVYDLVVTGQLSNDIDPRRRLNLGPSPARLRGELRAGTVLFDNWDVMLYAAVAAQNDPDTANSFASSYSELGGALAASFSHGVTAGASVRRRNLSRADPENGMWTLLDTGQLGERAFNEATLDAKWAAERRRFVADVEVFGRRYEQLTVGRGEEVDWYTGGRLRLEGRAGDTLRLLAEYELANVPDRTAGELGSLQTVRVLGEARF